MSDYLPQEVWVDILHRLSVKSLGKCACVCKAWKHLITNHAFISDHLSRNNGNRSLLLRFSRPSRDDRFGSFEEFYSLHLDNEQFDLISTVEYPFVDRFVNKRSPVVGICNGLICLADDFETYRDTLVVWNPSIRKYAVLPKPSVNIKPHGYLQVSVGFGFDSRNKDFKVVRIVILYDKQAHTHVEVYSLATGHWKNITGRATPFLLPSYVEKGAQIFMNGKVHWVASHGNSGTHNFILSFNVAEESFGELMLPQLLKDEALFRLSILPGGDSLAVYLEKESEFEGHFLSIWVMKEYGVVESWAKVFHFDPRGYGTISRPLALRSRGEVVLQSRNGAIILLDPMKESVKDLGLGIGGFFNVFVGHYVESLFLINKENDVQSY